MLPISSLTKFSIQDFPGHTSAILWFGGCNFRCPYCHNPEFILEKYSIISEGEVLDFLRTRIGLLDGVVFSGGECTLSDELYDFLEKVKGMGFKTKIDTNGTNPKLLKRLLSDGLLDFVALDYKAPEYKFESVSGTNKFGDFSESLDMLIASGLPMEVRTTVHTSLLNEDDLNNIIDDLISRNYGGTFFIQNFADTKGRTLGNIENQARILDKSLIFPKCLPVEYRNFKKNT